MAAFVGDASRNLEEAVLSVLGERDQPDTEQLLRSTRPGSVELVLGEPETAASDCLVNVCEDGPSCMMRRPAGQPVDGGGSCVQGLGNLEHSTYRRAIDGSLPHRVPRSKQPANCLDRVQGDAFCARGSGDGALRTGRAGEDFFIAGSARSSRWT